MKINQFLLENQVFTTADAQKLMPKQANVGVMLSRALKSGKIEKISRGLYVSRIGKYYASTVDPFLVARTLRRDATFVYHSALVLHGLEQTLLNTVQFMTQSHITPFTFEGTLYKSYAFNTAAQVEALSSRTFGSVLTTTREQTFVDSMAKLRLSGGLEEVLRGFAGLPYINVDTIVLCLDHYPLSVTARVGWYLEMNRQRWSLDESVLTSLEKRISPQSSYKLDPSAKAFEGYCSRWHLNLPVSQEILNTWMEK